MLTRKKGKETEMGFNDLDLMAVKNDFITITYGLHRSSGDFYMGDPSIINHLKYPLNFF